MNLHTQESKFMKEDGVLSFTAGAVKPPFIDEWFRQLVSNKLAKTIRPTSTYEKSKSSLGILFWLRSQRLRKGASSGYVDFPVHFSLL